MSRHIVLLTVMLLVATAACAQPAARRNQQKTPAQQKTAAAQNITPRAQISFPTSQQMKEDVVWRRDIYRQIDLTEAANSGLYYPVEPMGGQMNLFTYLFKLVLSGQLKAYEYRLDNNESFEPDAVVKPLTLLDDHHIYYERKDGKLKLDNSDIPSREVKSYYIKESVYYDQVSATFHTKVVALCPIMEDDFGDGALKTPLFWVKYDDAAPFLSKQTIMTSDINNAAMMSIDDYFVKNKYRGKIYKTNNMLGKTLLEGIPTDSIGADSVLNARQKRIENELKAFEANIWGDMARRDSLDSIAKAKAAMDPKELKKTEKENRRVAKATGTKASKPKQSRASSTSSAPRVSVRRQRH